MFDGRVKVSGIYVMWSNFKLYFRWGWGKWGWDGRGVSDIGRGSGGDWKEGCIGWKLAMVMYQISCFTIHTILYMFYPKLISFNYNSNDLSKSMFSNKALFSKMWKLSGIIWPSYRPCAQIWHLCITYVKWSVHQIHNLTNDWFPVILGESWWVLELLHVGQEMLALSGKPDFTPFGEFMISLFILYIMHYQICQSSFYRLMTLVFCLD